MEKIGFLEWLYKQKRQDTPIGDLVRDMIDDTTFPQYPAGSANDVTVLMHIYEYMRWTCHACDEALEALHEAWCQYTKQGPYYEYTWRCKGCYALLWPEEHETSSILWPSRDPQEGPRFDVMHTCCLEEYLEGWDLPETAQQCLSLDVLLVNPSLPMPALMWRRICAFHDHDTQQQRPPSGRRALSYKERWAIFMRDGFRCQGCGVHKDDGPHVRLHVDHRLAVILGGTNDRSNLWTLCSACNRGKGTQEL